LEKGASWTYGQKRWRLRLRVESIKVSLDSGEKIAADERNAKSARNSGKTRGKGIPVEGCQSVGRRTTEPTETGTKGGGGQRAH